MTLQQIADHATKRLKRTLRDRWHGGEDISQDAILGMIEHLKQGGIADEQLLMKVAVSKAVDGIRKNYGDPRYQPSKCGMRNMNNWAIEHKQENGCILMAL